VGGTVVVLTLAPLPEYNYEGCSYWLANCQKSQGKDAVHVASIFANKPLLICIVVAQKGQCKPQWLYLCWLLGQNVPICFCTAQRTKVSRDIVNVSGIFANSTLLIGKVSPQKGLC
jgi:hypothetical protein